jgi:transketolase
VTSTARRPVERARTDLRDPGSFDHVGRDVDATGFVAGRVLAELADTDDRIVAASADLTWVTQMAEFAAAHPDRYLQFGIAERNMISAAAGLATMGLIPYVSTFACFSGVLAFENIRTDLAYPHLPVRVLATHAGIAMGYFGTSHHATEDIAALRAVAGLTILSPAGATATESLLRGTVDHDGPIYLRLGRGQEADVYADPGAPAPPTGPGAPTALARGSDVLLVGTGLTTGSATAAAERLAAEGVSTGVVDVHTLKPFDGDAMAQLASGYRAVVTVEEHTVEGGLGSIVVEALARRRVPTPVFTHGLQDEFALVGPPSHLYRHYGLDPDGVATVARRALADGADPRHPLWTDADRQEVLAAVGGAGRRQGRPGSPADG